MNSLITGLILLITGIGLAAFGTHTLKTIMENSYLEIYKTATFYHIIIALSLITLHSHFNSQNMRLAPILITVGITIFSGSLYCLSIFKVKQIGLLTPLGGLLILGGLSYFLTRLIKRS